MGYLILSYCHFSLGAVAAVTVTVFVWPELGTVVLRLCWAVELLSQEGHVAMGMPRYRRAGRLEMRCLSAVQPLDLQWKRGFPYSPCAQ